MIWKWGPGNSVLQLHWMYPEPGREELQRDIAVCRKAALFVVQEESIPYSAQILLLLCGMVSVIL